MADRMLFASAALFCCLRKSCCSVVIQPGQLCMPLAVNWDNRKVLWYNERYDCKTIKSYRELLVHISW